MSVDTKLVPLATLADGRTLCTTPGQDQYFIVQTSGAKEKVDLHTACKWYLSAKEVVWGKRIKVASKKAKLPTPERTTKKWRNQMEAALKGTEGTPKE